MKKKTITAYLIKTKQLIQLVYSNEYKTYFIEIKRNFLSISMKFEI